MKRLVRTFKEKWPEYLLEILVITMGILGAYMLNNWNENRKSDRATRDALVNVLEDLRQDSIQFRFHVNNSTQLAANLAKTIDILLNNGSDDSLEFYYNRSRGYLVATVQNSAFRSMNQLGLVPKISNDSLRYGLMRYYDFLQPNVRALREFEYTRLESSVRQINTVEAIDKEATTFDDLQLDYQIVRVLLLQPENLKRLYDYRETQQFLVIRAQRYRNTNANLIRQLDAYLKD